MARPGCGLHGSSSEGYATASDWRKPGLPFWLPGCRHYTLIRNCQAGKPNGSILRPRLRRPRGRDLHHRLSSHGGIPSIPATPFPSSARKPLAHRGAFAYLHLNAFRRSASCLAYITCPEFLSLTASESSLCPSRSFCVIRASTPDLLQILLMFCMPLAFNPQILLFPNQRCHS